MNIIQDFKLQYKMGGIVQKLIFWNIGFFILPYFIKFLTWIFRIKFDFLYWVSVSADIKVLAYKPWTVLSYAFFHASFFHIFFNMLVLNFAGRLFLSYFLGKQLVNLYFVSAIFAGFLYVFSYFLFPSLLSLNTTMVGASGAIMALLVATTTYSPLMEIRLFLIGNIKLWHLTFALVILDLIQLPLENTGGHIAHLGGALFGFLYMKNLKNGTDITGWFTFLMDNLANIFSNKTSKPFKKVHKNVSSPPASSQGSIVMKSKVQQQIDDILDKISKSGYDSLSAAEKDFLFKAGK
jgi:membrane associated rhomboid family serine protease